MLAQMVKKVTPAKYVIADLDLPDFDITDRDLVMATLVSIKPGVIINCAAYTNVDACEANEDLAFKVNGAGPGYLAEAAVALNATLVHISTDYVFPGNKREPHVECDPTGPISAYGRSKLAGEQTIVSSGLVKYFILRTSWLYGPGGNNFVETILRLAGEREEIRIVADQHGSPTFTGDLARAIFCLLETAEARPTHGFYHFSNNGSCTWHEFACKIVKLAQEHELSVKVNNLVPIRTEDYPLLARRPAYSVFSKEKFEVATGLRVPDWQESLTEYFAARAAIK